MLSLKRLPNAYSRSHGYTLIEIMVVIVILGILASLIVPRIASRPEQARIVKAKQDIRVVESALEMYKLDNGFYPSTDQGLTALISKPSSEPIPQNWKLDGYLGKMPIDPWGHQYQYINPGTHGEIDIFSEGSLASQKDGKKIQIGNWTD